jgi:DNA repair exonuclease SbcCD nuclease subunit
MKHEITLIHTADLHLGSSFAAWPGRTEALQANQLQVLLQIVDYCRTRAADLLLIAGDCFDQLRPPQALLREVRDLLQLIPETRIFIAPGNHDPAEPGSPWLTADWPKHVHIFVDSIEAVDLPQLGARIYGAAFRGTAAPEPLVTKLEPAPDPGLINILLLHGDVSGNLPQVYNPISSAWLAESGLDYVALGHVHQFGGFRQVGPTPVRFAYCGCPSGRGFDELGPKGVICGHLARVGWPDSLSGGRAFYVRSELDWLEMPGRQFLEIVVNLDQPDRIAWSCESLCTAILKVMQQNGPPGCMAKQQTEAADDWRDHLYRVCLTGATDEPLPALARLQTLLEREVFAIRVIDQTTRRIDLAALSGEHSLKGALIRQILAGTAPVWDDLTDDQREQLQIGLQAFTGEVLFRADR